MMDREQLCNALRTRWYLEKEEIDAIYAESRKADIILPVFNYYNKFGSTKYVRGQTTRDTYPTKHSHVNVVVADTESWEQIAADERITQIDNFLNRHSAKPHHQCGSVVQTIEADATASEREIDQLVYKLYGLTPAKKDSG